jgi:copper(I)-binding protein
VKRLILGALVLVLMFSLAACSTGGSEQAACGSGELTVSDVQANMTLPSDTGSLWMKIQNGTDTDDELIGAEFDGCAAIELHNMVIENDVMVMREVDGGKIPIPAGETVELKKGGLHVMCIGKEAQLEAGTNLDVVLKFAKAGDVAVTAVVVEPGEMPMNMDQGEMDSGG